MHIIPETTWLYCTYTYRQFSSCLSRKSIPISVHVISNSYIDRPLTCTVFTVLLSRDPPKSIPVVFINCTCCNCRLPVLWARITSVSKCCSFGFLSQLLFRIRFSRACLFCCKLRVMSTSTFSHSSAAPRPSSHPRAPVVTTSNFTLFHIRSLLCSVAGVLTTLTVSHAWTPTVNNCWVGTQLLCQGDCAIRASCFQLRRPIAHIQLQVLLY